MKVKIKKSLPSAADARKYLRLGTRNGHKLTAAERSLFQRLAKGSRPKRRLNNPPVGKVTEVVYDQVGGIWARMGQKHICDAKCKAVDHWYEHVYSEKFPILGLPRGTVLLLPNGQKVRLPEKRILI